MQALLLGPYHHLAYKPIRKVLEDTLREFDITPVSVDDTLVEPGVLLVNTVIDAVKASNFVVADVSEKNSNVLYELGFAFALGKPTLLTLNTEVDATVPPTLAGYQMTFYHPNDLASLKHSISRFVEYQVSKVRMKKLNA